MHIRPSKIQTHRKTLTAGISGKRCCSQPEIASAEPHELVPQYHRLVGARSSCELYEARFHSLHLVFGELPFVE
ncbi:MAG: hypothetical protein IJG82_03935, partial [Atopobiaceae bacterium]|nr:hypothetical protein [Atopobiaceae bacterium]